MRIPPEAKCDVTTRNRDTMRNLCDYYKPRLHCTGLDMKIDAPIAGRVSCC